MKLFINFLFDVCLVRYSTAKYVYATAAQHINKQQAAAAVGMSKVAEMKLWREPSSRADITQLSQIPDFGHRRTKHPTTAAAVQLEL